MDIDFQGLKDVLCENCIFFEDCIDTDAVSYCKNPTIQKLFGNDHFMDPGRISARENKETPQNLSIDAIPREIHMLDHNALLYEFFFEAAEYFNALGYHCSINDLFFLIPQTSGKIQIENLLRATFVHSRQEAYDFSYDYRLFVRRFFYHDESIQKYQEAKKKALTAHKKKLHMIHDDLERLRIRHDRQTKMCECNSLSDNAVLLEKQQSKIAGLHQCMENTFF